MPKAVDSAATDLSPLRSLCGEKPATRMGRVRSAWPEIQAALAVGHSLKTIHGRLQESGIEISYRTLSLYLGRLRRKEAGTLAHQTARQTTPASVPRPAEPEGGASTKAKRDALLSLRELNRKRPGFHFDEGPPDLSKLI